MVGLTRVPSFTVKSPWRDTQEEEGRENGEEDCFEGPSDKRHDWRDRENQQGRTKRLSMAMHDAGCSAGYIVSQLIIQGCDFIEVEEEA